MKYFLFLLKHKWYVFLAGILFTKANLFDLIVHDWNKFTPSQFIAYRNKHNKRKNKSEINNNEILKSWLYHQNLNKHHWEFWIARTGHGDEGLNETNILVEIPERYAREMVADWFAAARTYGNDPQWPDVLNWPWMKKQGAGKMRNRIHPNSIKLIDKIFEEISSEYKCNDDDNTSIFSNYLENYSNE